MDAVIFFFAKYTLVIFFYKYCNSINHNGILFYFLTLFKNELKQFILSILNISSIKRYK